MATTKTKSKSISYLVREIKEGDKEILAQGFAGIIKYALANDSELFQFDIIKGHPKLAIPTMIHQGYYVLVQCAGPGGSMNVARYNPELKDYTSSAWFQGCHTGNIGLVKYDDKVSGKGLEGGAKAFNDAFGNMTGYELVKVVSKDVKTTSAKVNDGLTW